MDLTPEHIARLRLIRTRGVGPVGFASLMEICGDAQTAVARLPDLCRERKRKVLTPPTEREVMKEIKAVEKLGGQFIFLGEDNYPPLLAHIKDAPPVLTVLGDVHALHKPQVAIVGNRNASTNGVHVTYEMAEGLTQAGYAITSGLARGVDTAAHKAALASGGLTIAVVAGGIDFIYPKENQELYGRIVQHGGAIVAEAPFGTKPEARHFPRRNRIISGLSLGVLVTESNRHSGSLITSRCAGEQGREVMAVPGNPKDPRAAGPNHLIKQGAAMVGTVEDVIDTLPALENMESFTPASTFSYTREGTTRFSFDEDLLESELDENTDNEASDIRQQVLSALSPTPVATDTLAEMLNVPKEELIITLTELDIEGQISQHPGGMVAKRA